MNGSFIVLPDYFLWVATKSLLYYNISEKNLQSPSHDCHIRPSCSCQMTKTSEIDISQIELQQVCSAMKQVNSTVGSVQIISKKCIQVLILYLFMSCRLWAEGILQQFFKGHTRALWWLSNFYLQPMNIILTQKRRFMSYCCQSILALWTFLVLGGNQMTKAGSSCCSLLNMWVKTFARRQQLLKEKTAWNRPEKYL